MCQHQVDLFQLGIFKLINIISCNNMGVVDARSMMKKKVIDVKKRI